LVNSFFYLLGIDDMLFSELYFSFLTFLICYRLLVFGHQDVQNLKTQNMVSILTLCIYYTRQYTVLPRQDFLWHCNKWWIHSICICGLAMVNNDV